MESWRDGLARSRKKFRKRRVAVEGRTLGSVSKANLADQKGRRPLFL